MYYGLELENKKQIIVPSNWCDNNLNTVQIPSGNRNLRKRKLNREDPGENWKTIEISEVIYSEGKLLLYFLLLEKPLKSCTELYVDFT